ncbi:ABC transporter permease [Parabacteroides sp. OttesenSCG-928-N08]|nr:ABC transporter permease [Parabacteroides sp. OttesenSCG-928-N08]
MQLHYLRQAIQMLKQNRFISFIAVMGTALAIMMIMAIIVSEEVKNISVAPEVNRDRTYYITREATRDTVMRSSSSNIVSIELFNTYMRDLKTPELISATTIFFVTMMQTQLVGNEGSSRIMDGLIRITDPAYFRILSFEFIEGRALGDAEYESGIAEAVITDRVAKELFKGESPLGQTIELEFSPFRVVGVVREVSPVFTMAYSDIWISNRTEYGKANSYGSQIMIQLADNRDYPALEAEIRAIEAKYGVDHPNMVLTLTGPVNHRGFMVAATGGQWMMDVEEMVKRYNRKHLFILFVLMLVPAINLSSISLSRIKKRTEEIGVRKAFGAKKHVILFQVLYENLITSLLGGVIGLFLSYWVVIEMKNWLLDIPSDSVVPINTLVSFPVFIAVFVVCLLINLLSAGIPAYRASRMNIVNSLHRNAK